MAGKAQKLVLKAVKSGPIKPGTKAPPTPTAYQAFVVCVTSLLQFPKISLAACIDKALA